VDEAVPHAFRNAHTRDATNGVWYGEAHGVPIMGYYNPQTGALAHGFPYLQ
jgi:hypothetical protein